MMKNVKSKKYLPQYIYAYPLGSGYCFSASPIPPPLRNPKLIVDVTAKINEDP